MIYGGYFDIATKEARVKELSLKLNENNFWDNKKEAEDVVNEINEINGIINLITKLKLRLNDYLDMVLLLKDDYDDQIKIIVEQELKPLSNEVNNLALMIFLNEPYDKNNAILEIQAGAGGIEACDWANMLFRMYLRWCEGNNYRYEIIDVQEEEVGLKRATIFIKGHYAYGYLKGEKGVHRLVRLSPFNAVHKRHTSFAAVDITPEIDKDNEIEIKETDLKIDVYRSSGAGGQSVNTTDSAVRITHLPSGIVVTCQNERSQLQNKAKAIQILKSKLYQLESLKIKEQLSSLKGASTSINFGSQIRSYIMHPYKMVKDHRTNYQTSKIEEVLDGHLSSFMESFLKNKISH